MRTTTKFVAIFNQVDTWVTHHKTPVWLVPLEDKYVLSVIKPKPEELHLEQQPISMMLVV